SGSMTVTPDHAGTDTYTLSCTVPAGVSRSAILNVNPKLAKIAISVAGCDTDNVGDHGTLVWTVDGGTRCPGTGTWPNHSAPQFSSPFPVSSSGSKPLTFNAAGTYTYTLSCTNVSTPVQTSVVIKPYGN